MYREMSRKERREWDDRADELHNSESLVDRIAAVLFDIRIGAEGVREDLAILKAQEVYDRLWPRLKFKLPEAYADDDYDEQ